MKGIKKINERVGVFVTRLVGNMWTAYLFTVWSLLPLVVPQMTLIVQYVSQDIIQLVLLSVIMVGQDVASRESERRHDTQMSKLDSEVLAELAELKQLHRELHAKLDAKQSNQS